MGAWAEVHFCDRHGEPQLTLLLLCDAHAQEDYLSHLNLSARDPRFTSLAPPTLLGTATLQRKGVSMWTLSPVEVDILVDMIASYQGGSFKRHMESMASAYIMRQGAQALCVFIRHVPRLSQYLGRLIQHEDNHTLRATLLERFEQTPQLR